MSKRRASRAKPQAATDEPEAITITGKRVTLGNGDRHERGTVLVIGETCTQEDADGLFANGLCMDAAHGIGTEAALKAHENAKATNDMVQRKQRAEEEMRRHDQMSEQDRLAEHEGEPEEGGDLIDFAHAEVDEKDGPEWEH